MLRSALLSLLLLLALGATQATAKTSAVRVPVPAAGKASAVFANLKGKGTRLSAKRVPKGVAVFGSVAGGKLAVVAARPKAGKAKGPIVLTLQGAKPSLTWTLKDIAKGGVPAEFCPGLATAWAKVLRRGAGASDGRALAAAAGCGEKPQPSGGVQPPASGVKPATTPAAPKPPAPPAKPSTGGNGGSADACKNGKDDDGDGQADFRGAGVTNPDPGCTSASDASEGDELLVNADCASVTGVFRGAQGVSAAINGDCPPIEDAWITVRPGVTGCTVASADSNYSCTAEHGLLHAKRTTGAPGTNLDFFTVNVAGPVDCATPPTIAIVSPDGTVAELVKPWPASCGGTQEPAAQCANGLDDDADGQADAIDAAGATTPDPGCTSTTDTTEDSEIAQPAGCDVTMGHFETGILDAAFSARDCGTLTGAWFNPSRQPNACSFAFSGDEHLADCSLTGSVASVSFPATSRGLFVIAPVDVVPECDAPLTAALRRQDGAVIEITRFWRDDTC